MPAGARYYEIRIQGCLEECWIDWLAELEITHLVGETLLTGVFPDQTALHGILERIRDLNIELISVVRQ